MSVTGSQIDLKDGETEKIITDDQGDRTYLVEIVGSNPIRVSHNKRYANDGTTLSAGQTHTVSNLRGERLYAAAYNGDSALRVREASADVQSQPEKEVNVVEGTVEIPGEIEVSDRESREIGKARVQDSDGTLIDPVTEQTAQSINTQLSSGTVNVQRDENQDNVTSFSVDATNSIPSHTVPAGIKVLVQADPGNIDPIAVGSVSLQPGNGISLSVNDPSVIETSGTAGDKINVLFEG